MNSTPHARGRHRQYTLSTRPLSILAAWFPDYLKAYRGGSRQHAPQVLLSTPMSSHPKTYQQGHGGYLERATETPDSIRSGNKGIYMFCQAVFNSEPCKDGMAASTPSTSSAFARSTEQQVRHSSDVMSLTPSKSDANSFLSPSLHLGRHSVPRPHSCLVEFKRLPKRVCGVSALRRPFQQDMLHDRPDQAQATNR